MKTYIGIITQLPDNGIAVIGCNPVGINGNPIKGTGGSMLIALNKGWVKQGEKLNNSLASSGKLFGLTTVSWPGKKRSKTVEEIKKGIEILYSYADTNPDKDFYVFYSAGGRNLNGYSDQEMAEIFSSHSIPQNIVFEYEFSKMIKQ